MRPQGALRREAKALGNDERTRSLERGPWAADQGRAVLIENFIRVLIRARTIPR